jgi:hypothetical protein
MPCRKVSMSTLQGKQNANADKRELLCRRKKPEEFTNSSCTSTRTVIRTLMISKLQELSNESRDLRDAIVALGLCGSQGPGRAGVDEEMGETNTHGCHLAPRDRWPSVFFSFPYWTRLILPSV